MLAYEALGIGRQLPKRLPLSLLLTPKLQHITQTATSMCTDVAERQAAAIHAPDHERTRYAENCCRLFGRQFLILAQNGHALLAEKPFHDIANDGDRGFWHGLADAPLRRWQCGQSPASGPRS